MFSLNTENRTLNTCLSIQNSPEFASLSSFSLISEIAIDLKQIDRHNPQQRVIAPEGGSR